MKRVAISLAVLVIGALAGSAVGFWWMTTTEDEICARLSADCGEYAMATSDCLQGRQQDLLKYGVGAMRTVTACLQKAPHDCMSVSACVASAGQP